MAKFAKFCRIENESDNPAVCSSSAAIFKSTNFRGNLWVGLYIVKGVRKRDIVLISKILIYISLNFFQSGVDWNWVRNVNELIMN